MLDRRFEITERAAQGGMGEIFRAIDWSAGEIVAVKVVHAVEDAPRFLREGGMLAQLSHPGIVRYMAQGTTPAGAPYLVMEWLDGEDLGARLRRGPLSVDDAITLMAGAAEALAVVHRRGIVHRDLKPTNLFLVNGDVARVKLLDFGIACLPAGTRITRNGIILGTPAYMAPEQVRSGDPIDARADVFALGCVLFECLTGRLAFMGHHPQEILMQILYVDVPRLSEDLPDIPPALDEMCARMLAKDPGARPRDAAALAEAIAMLGLGATLPVGTQPPPEPSSASLGGSERLVRSIVLLGFNRDDESSVRAEAETRVADAPDGMREDAQTRGAALDVLADGTVLVSFAGAGLATDQAAQAARCALSLRARAGGRPMALATGRAELTGRLPTGDLIRRAMEALKQAASAHDGVKALQAIAIDEVTAGLLDARFDVAETEEGLWLRGEQALAKGARTLLGKHTACVGRGWELDLLAALVTQCFEEPHARAVLLTGSAGMGKTRVAAELLNRLRKRDAPIAFWIARGDPLRAGAPLGLLGQALQDAVGIQDGEPPEARKNKIHAQVSGYVGAAEAQRVAEFLGELVGTPFPDEDSVQLRAARGDARLLGEQMRRAWVDFLDAVCAAQPVLLILEDLHWGDLPTVDYIDEALRCLQGRPCMVLALARPEVHEQFPRLWAGRNLQEIRLNPLSTAASVRLVRQVLGEDVDEDALESLVAQANGNAFYLEELIRAASAGSKARPETVLAMVQSRLEGLDEASRRLLRAGSVFGDVFWQGAVEALLGMGGAISIDRHLESLEKDEECIVTRAESRFQGQREFQFRHALVREAAYGMLTEGDRALGHRLAGAWLERAAEPSAAVMAEHFDRGGEPARAVEFYRKAAAQALAANDLRAVLMRTERALMLGASVDVSGECLLLQTEVHFRRGDLAMAGSCAHEALQILPQGSARWYDAVRLAGLVAGDLMRYERLVALADELVATWSKDNVSGPMVVATAAMGRNLLFAGLYDRADVFHAQIEAMAERVRDDPAVSEHVYRERALYEQVAGNPGPSVDLTRRAIECHERAGNWHMACLERSNLGITYCQFGAYEEAVALLRSAVAEAERMGWGQNLALTFMNLGMALGCLGDLEEARTAEGTAIARFAAIGGKRMEGVSHAYLAGILLGAGELEEAEIEARRASEMLERAPPHQVPARATLARVLLVRGEPVKALVEAREAMTVLESLGKVHEGEALTRLIHAEALFENGDHEAARAAIADARDRVLRAAARIEDPRWRDSFLHNVGENARTLELARDWLCEDGVLRAEA